MKTFALKAAAATTLDLSKWKTFILNALLVLVSTFVTYLLNNLTTLDFGANSAAIVAILTIVLHYLQQWLAILMGGGVVPTPVPPKNPDIDVINLRR